LFQGQVFSGGNDRVYLLGNPVRIIHLENICYPIRSIIISMYLNL